MRLAHNISRFIETRSNITVAAALFVLTLGVMFMYRPFSQAEDGDAALIDYISQCVVRGQTLYRDVIDIKAPGSFFLNALAMKAGSAVGIRDIFAVRLLQIVMTSLLSAVVYFVAVAYLRNRFAGVLSALVLLAFPHFALWTVGGGQPKLPMILFGMLTLLLIAKDRPFLAGLCSMLSCLCWQPGLLFTGVAFLMFSRYLTSWRDLRALKVIAGAAIPLAATVLYFAGIGALDEFWTWTVVFNYSVYARRSLEGAGRSFGHLVNVALRIFSAYLVFVVPSIVGFAMFVVQRLRRKQLESSELFRDAIVIAPAAYFAACLIRFNAGPYLIPFLPFIGLFFAWLILEPVRLVKERSPQRKSIGPATATLLPVVVSIVLLGIAAHRAFAYQFESILTLRAQEEQLEPVTRLIGSSDTIYVHGSTEILVLTNKANLNAFVFLDWGKDDFIAAKNYGGSFDALVAEIESHAPKIVALGRLQKVAHRDDFRKWVEQHYENLEIPGYSVYVRKSQTGM